MQQDLSDTKRLQTRIIAYTVMMACLFGVLIGVAGILPIREQLRLSSERFLLHVLDMHTQGIERQLSRNETLARQISSRSQIREKLALYNRGIISGDALRDFTAPKLEDALRASAEVAGITRMDRAGNVVASVGMKIPQTLAKPPSSEFRNDTISGPFSMNGKHYVLIGTPILDHDNVLQGTDIVAFTMAGIQDFITDYKHLGNTGETILLIPGSTGGMKAAFPLRTGPADTKSWSEITSLFSEAIKNPGQVAHIHAKPGDGEMIAAQPVETTGWVIMIRMNEDELFAESDKTIFMAVIGVLTLIVFGGIGLAIILRPMTGRILVEAKQLSRQDHELRKLYQAVQQSGSSIIITSPKGSIEYVNPKFSEITGYAAEEVLGENPRILKSGRMKDEEYQLFWKTISDGNEWRGELQNKRKDGSLYWVLASISPVRGPEGEITNYVGIEEDITDRKLIEQQLIAAKEEAELSNRAKTEFLANMSHELRTPLNSVIGFSDIMSREMFGPLGSPKYLEYVANVGDSGRHLLQLINDVLDVSRIETGDLSLAEQSIDIPTLFGSCRHLIEGRANANKVTLRVKTQSPISGLLADARRVKQILLNLLSNAVKFTPKGGNVSLLAEYDETGAIVFKVVDSGIGIAAEDIEKAMAVFGQVDSTLERRYEGTGLGLPLSKKLAELHGGTLTLTSTLGKGTTVTVRFPPERSIQLD
ncbi:MAG: PAS domain S-box protein [Rhodospirillales bacterium]|nr:PAS domain S-box protein [Rhodospirillales bacterium]